MKCGENEGTVVAKHLVSIGSAWIVVCHHAVASWLLYSLWVQRFDILLGEKIFCKNEMQVGMGVKEVQKQGRDERTRRLSCCTKVAVKKDRKTTLLLLQRLSPATEVE